MSPDVTKVRSILRGYPGLEVVAADLGVVVNASGGDVVSVLADLRASELDLTMLVDLFGVDAGDAVQVTYHLRSLSRDEDLYVRTAIGYGETLTSVWNIFASALLPERETAELFGLKLAGHPNPKRLLTTEGEEPLLRRSVPIRTLEEVRDR